jgi:serine/threonine-protein kinase
VILYEVLTGKLPFTAKTPMEYIQKHVMEPPIPLNQRVPERHFTDGLEAVLQKALAKKPDDRFQTAAEFADALRPFADANASSYSSQRVALKSSPEPPQVVSVQNPTPNVSSPTASRGPGAGLLIGVAATCLVIGVVIAVVVMQFMAH